LGFTKKICIFFKINPNFYYEASLSNWSTYALNEINCFFVVLNSKNPKDQFKKKMLEDFLGKQYLYKK